MSTYPRLSPRALFRDRRVQIGGAVALSCAAFAGAGLIAVLASSRAEANPPELADHARLAIVAQAPPREPLPAMGDRLATLDPERIAAQQQSQPADPQLPALLADERRSDAQAQAEQRAFDARMRAELADTPTDSEPVAQRGGSTSNSEDVADPGAA